MPYAARTTFQVLLASRQDVDAVDLTAATAIVDMTVLRTMADWERGCSQTAGGCPRTVFVAADSAEVLQTLAAPRMHRISAMQEPEVLPPAAPPCADHQPRVTAPLSASADRVNDWYALPTLCGAVRL